ncbi:EamA family transporter [Salinisphaera sp. USBA-960]|uniref:EamA family transporter n=1 Tax=Salinisphaera orenii TaxID=856731 RepID=UPI000DBE560C|nr:EamA family transporter [Salifodinibacter halophilus]NNC25744.1 EamA family transporter [Salifodinibacter halophilus]
MGYLWTVTALWAFSFSLIGVYLSGQVDNYFSILTRLALASLLLAPFLRPRAIPPRAIIGLMAIGAVQIGLMYICLYQAYLWLSVPELILFTVATPIYISLLDDLMVRRFRPIYLLAAGGAVAGAAIIRYHGVGNNIWVGFCLIQAANLCFAIGQVAYRRLVQKLPSYNPTHVFGWFFIGAIPVAALAFGLFGDWHQLPTTGMQWSVLAWLGLGSSGVGYLLWNSGATQVSAGALAVMNNVLVPAGLLVNIVIWNHDANLIRLTAGGAVILLALAATRLVRDTPPHKPSTSTAA